MKPYRNQPPGPKLSLKGSHLIKIWPECMFKISLLIFQQRVDLACEETAKSKAWRPSSSPPGLWGQERRRWRTQTTRSRTQTSTSFATSVRYWKSHFKTSIHESGRSWSPFLSFFDKNFTAMEGSLFSFWSYSHPHS